MQCGPIMAFPVLVASLPWLLAQEEEDDSQDAQRQRGQTGWACQQTRLASLLSTCSARAPPPFREGTNCDEVRKSRARHGRTQTQTKTLAIVKQKERTEN